MRAVGFTRSLPVDDPECLLDIEVPVPEPTGRQLRVQVLAASVNPVDVKRRQNVAAAHPLDAPMILGFDAVGTVDACGEDVELFRCGDAVWYSGSIDRSGSNAELQLVDERIVGRRPRNLGAPEAAALPLTALTAWEALFDRMRIAEGGGDARSLLIIGGAGGVGSIAIQLAKALTGLRVIATASRDETRQWCERMGADVIANHYDLVNSVRESGAEHVDYILNCADLLPHWDGISELIAPEGTIVSIVHAEGPVNLTSLMQKSATFAWEMMSTRPMFETPSMSRQHEILNRLAELVDSEIIRSTMTETLIGLTAATLVDGHARIESGRMIGKLCIDYDAALS